MGDEQLRIGVIAACALGGLIGITVGFAGRWLRPAMLAGAGLGIAAAVLDSLLVAAGSAACMLVALVLGLRWLRADVAAGRAARRARPDRRVRPAPLAEPGGRPLRDMLQDDPLASQSQAG